MGHSEIHAAKMLDVMFSWRGAATFLISACIAMTFRSPWLVCFVALLFIGLWAWLVRRSGAKIKDEAHALIDKLIPVKSVGSTTIFTDHFERFRSSSTLCLAVFLTVLVVADDISDEARQLDNLAGLPVSAELSTLDLMAGAEAWPLIMLVPLFFFLLNTMMLLIRQLFIVETNDGVRRLSVITTSVLLIYGFIKSGALYFFPLAGAIYVTLGLAAILAGKWVITGFTNKDLSISAAAKDGNNE